ncbi:hypothetical protein CYY_007845 [Polysphondylium violaceum]|uniref:Uncharacterized protein n=1 Tax=Polysphondylium violaceum TaxID=133409 RepID=A0A8J4PWL8_9MYCE|nr:hypothetical protein CYY_007845 [Polysphondylium violaceum]
MYNIPANLKPTIKSFDLPPLQGETKEFAPQAWFLGPKSENRDLLAELVTSGLKRHVDGRLLFHPEDAPVFDEDFKKTPAYLNATDDMKKKTDQLLTFLQKSLPFSSLRYVGHMCSDVTIAAAVGYISTILYNPNNVTIQASPVTSYIEMAVGNDLCRMVGFEFPVTKSTDKKKKKQLKDDAIYPSCHLTSGGTVANCEAVWASYWAKFVPLALQEALIHESDLAAAKDITVKLCNGIPKKLSLLTSWEGVNIPADECVALPYRIADLCKLDPSKVTFICKQYHPSNVGLRKFLNKHELNDPVLFASASGHYSLPKAAALLGLGSDSLKLIPVDLHTRMDTTNLRAQLQACISHHIPIINVTCVQGSTEESSVDDFATVVKFRKEFNLKGLEFFTHLDYAWGGYYLSCIRDDYELENPETDVYKPQPAKKVATPFNSTNNLDPKYFCSNYFEAQMEAAKHCDTMTIDPHKAGYIPYPAGSVLYRNKRFRDILVFTATYIGGTNSPGAVGIYGIEGSKPGAAAAAVYLSHAIVRTSKSGYGQILKRTLLNTKLFYLRLLWLVGATDNFTVTGIPIPPPQAQLDSLKARLIVNGVMISSEEICKDLALVQELAEIGPDQNIICYTFNFKTPAGVINTDYQKLLTFNQKVYERFDYVPETGMKEFDVIVSNTDFLDHYGTPFLTNLASRIGVTNAPAVGVAIPAIRSTIMDPFANETTQGSAFDKVMSIFKTEITKIAASMVQESA